MNGKTICECGRDDIHSSKDCWTIENRIKALNELAKQAQELDMGYSSNEKPFRYDNHELLEGYIVNDYIEQVEELKKEIDKLKADKAQVEIIASKMASTVQFYSTEGVKDILKIWDDYLNKKNTI